MAVPRPSDPAADPDSLPALLALAAHGETAALARVIRVRHEALTRVALVVTLDGATAAASVDAVWPGAWRTLQGRGVPADPESWLARLVADEARFLVASDDPPVPGGTDPAGEEREPIPAVLGTLRPADRRRIALRHVAGVEPGPATRGPFAAARQALTGARDSRLGAGPDAGVDGSAVQAWVARARVRPVNADATARRARAEAGMERARRLSVAVSIVAGAVVLAAPYLVPLVFRT